MFLVHSYSISFLLPLLLYLVLSSVFSGLCSFFTCYLQVPFPCKYGLLGCPFVQVFPFSILVKQHDRVIIFCLMLLRRLVSVPIGKKHFIDLLSMRGHSHCCLSILSRFIVLRTEKYRWVRTIAWLWNCIILEGVWVCIVSVYYLCSFCLVFGFCW